MIHRDKIEEKEVTIVEFGGDVLVANGECPGAKSVILANLPDKVEIGTEFPGYVGKSTIELHSCVELRFHNPASIDVLMEALRVAKSSLTTVDN